MSSFVSVKGPSMTVFFPPEKRTRLPLLLGWRPSAASMMPAFTSDSLNLPISANSFSLGMMPASEFFVAFTITMTRIALLLLVWGTTRGRAALDRLRALAGLEHRPHFGLALEFGPVFSVQLHELGRDPDRFCLRVRLQDCPAADDLLALGERAVRHADLALGQSHADAIFARQQTARIDEGAVLERFLHKLVHRLHQRWGWLGLAIRLGMADERQVFHCSSRWVSIR